MKKQQVIFGITMSIIMAYGMEVYNTAWKMGIPLLSGGFSNMTYEVFLAALQEAAFMWIIVFVISAAWGTKAGAHLGEKLVDQKRDSPFVRGLARSGATVAVMCPTMSLVASILFSIVLAGVPLVQLPAVWVGTVLKNFPMALLWNIFVATPLTKTITRKICG
ncbi:MAG: hypothetical protein ACOX4F_08235 [Atopobiaceae bacterium]|jgi:hypothetical protein